MTASPTASADKLLSQPSFDFILGVSNRETLTVEFVCGRLSISDDTVRNLVSNGQLYGYTYNGRGNPNGPKTNVIFTESVRLFLAKSANCDPLHRVDAVLKVLESFTPEMRQRVIEGARKQQSQTKH